MDQKIVTLIGGTGYLGGKIAKELKARGAHVRAMVRATSDRAGLIGAGVTDFVTGDMMDAGSLKKVFEQLPKAGSVIASSAGYTRHTEGDSEKTDTEGYRNVADAVKAAMIPRFILISILECDKALSVPHFYNKHLTENYLREIGQPFIALRAGAFLDQSRDFVLASVKKGIYPALVTGVPFGMIYTSDLARYAAMAALDVPDDELGSVADVGWERPVSGEDMAAAFSRVLGRTVVCKPAIPAFALNFVMPLSGIFNPRVKDMHSMIKWIKTGVYKSNNTQKQKELFSELPTVDEVVKRYCLDNNLI